MKAVLEKIRVMLTAFLCLDLAWFWKEDVLEIYRSFHSKERLFS